MDLPDGAHSPYDVVGSHMLGISGGAVAGVQTSETAEMTPRGDS